MSKISTLDLVDVIEGAARDGVRDHGRGLVICFEGLDGKIEHVLYAQMNDIGNLFSAHVEDDLGFVEKLQTYDQDREYILMDIVQLDESQAEATPIYCAYRIQLSA